MSSILAPICPAGYKNGHLKWYGVAEFDVLTGEVVWKFDAITSDLAMSELYQDGNVLRRKGFSPQSVQRLSEGGTLISDYNRGIIVDEEGDVKKTFTHELMNDNHEIQQTNEGTFLVTSTGLDTILLLDEEFNELWRWHMWEHLDERTRPSEYFPDKVLQSHQGNLAYSPDYRYHLNYATVIEGSTLAGEAILLCSALNYGIFTVNMENDEIEHKFTELNECHNPYPMNEKYVVPESGADRVVVIDWDQRYEILFDEGLNFVKDADAVGEGGDWLLTDTKNDRVLLWNQNKAKPKWEFHLGKDAKPYEADYLTGDFSFK